MIPRENLNHALANDCTDPDCEIHHPEVGFEEGTVGLTEIAFWVAGFYAGADFVAQQAVGQVENVYDELMAQGIVPKPFEVTDPRD